jgi:hypothetical protein
LNERLIYNVWVRHWLRRKPLRWVKVRGPLPWAEAVGCVLDPPCRGRWRELRFLPVGQVPVAGIDDHDDLNDDLPVGGG